MKNNELLNKDEMLNLLPDYAFGNLDEKDTELFESNLPEYPELKDEVNEIRDAFDNIHSDDYSNHYNHASRNISVGVMEKLSEKKAFGFLNTKVLIPAGAMVIFALLFIPAMFQDKLDFSSYEIPNIFSDDEVSMLYEDEYFENDFSEFDESALELDTYTDDLYDYDDYEIDDNNIYDLIEIEESTSFDFTSLNNEDFEQLYEDLQNVTIEL